MCIHVYMSYFLPPYNKRLRSQTSLFSSYESAGPRNPAEAYTAFLGLGQARSWSCLFQAR